MAAVRSKELVRRAFDLLPEVVDQNNINALDEVMASDIRVHGTTGEHHGLASFKQAVEQQSQALDQNSITIHHLVAEGDDVAATFTHSLTFTKDFAGMPARGKNAKFSGTAHFRIVGDKIAEMWMHEDIPSMTAQLSN